MDIAAYSMSNSQSTVQTNLNLALTKKTMEDAEQLSTDLIDKMIPSAPSAYGFDTYA